ncbi:MAG: TRAP transporter substrate-binding protein [Actinobacteria bacterium]|nr:MAG: TRAP transporter substrate-binding protein [Actinomycetota bacterium]
MNKKLSLAVILGLIVVLVFTSISFAQQKLKMGMMEAKIQPAGEAAGRFAELVEKYTDGKYKVDVYYGAALGETGDVMEQVMDGKVQLYWCGISWLENVADDFKIFSLNWAFDGNDHLAKFFETKRFEEMKAELEKLDLKLIGNYAFRNPRNLLTKKPILSIEDIQGVLLRVPPQPMYQKSWAAVGANPTQMDYGEVYMALRQGVIDGMENPIESIFGRSFQEVASYLTFTQHLLNPYVILMTADLFNSLDKDTQNAFIRAAKESGKWFADSLGAVEEEYIRKMMRENSAVFIRIDTTPFSEKIRPLAHELEGKGEWSEGLFDYVRSLVE